MAQVTQNANTIRHPVTQVESSLNVGATARGVRMKNLGPNVAYFALATGVLSTTGYPIAVNESIDLDLQPDADGIDFYWICAATETASIAVLVEA